MFDRLYNNGMAIRWRRHEFGSEYVVDVPNAVEPEYPFKLRLTVYDLLSDDEGEKVPKPDERFRAHATFSGHELFRVWASTLVEAQQRTEKGVRDVVAALAAVVGAELSLPEVKR